MSDEHLPALAGPVPDRITIWPVDDGRYGRDATFHGASGYERAERHEAQLERRGIPHMRCRRSSIDVTSGRA
jgi:hypothetical protein